MTNATAPPQRPLGAKSTTDAYTVDRYGVVVKPPHATVVAPHGYEPLPNRLGTRLEPCACFTHRKTGATR